MSEFTKTSVGQLKPGQLVRLANAPKQKSQPWRRVISVANTPGARTKDLTTWAMDGTEPTTVSFGYPTRFEIKTEDVVEVGPADAQQRAELFSETRRYQALAVGAQEKPARQSQPRRLQCMCEQPGTPCPVHPELQAATFTDDDEICPICEEFVVNCTCDPKPAMVVTVQAPKARKDRVSGALTLAMRSLAAYANRSATRRELHADPMVVKAATTRGWVTVDRSGTERSVDLIVMTAAGAARWVR